MTIVYQANNLRVGVDTLRPAVLLEWAEGDICLVQSLLPPPRLRELISVLDSQLKILEALPVAKVEL